MSVERSSSVTERNDLIGVAHLPTSFLLTPMTHRRLTVHNQRATLVFAAAPPIESSFNPAIHRLVDGEYVADEDDDIKYPNKKSDITPPAVLPNVAALVENTTLIVDIAVNVENELQRKTADTRPTTSCGKDLTTPKSPAHKSRPVSSSRRK